MGTGEEGGGVCRTLEEAWGMRGWEVRGKEYSLSAACLLLYTSIATHRSGYKPFPLLLFFKFILFYANLYFIIYYFFPYLLILLYISLLQNVTLLLMEKRTKKDC